jgi:hypothetical protein
MIKYCQASILPDSTIRIGQCEKLVCLTILLIASFQSHAQQKDTLYFYNKSKVVGKLLSISLGRIEFDAEGIGIVKIKNSKVETMNATSRSFRIKTMEGNELQGHIARSEKPGMVNILAIFESNEISLDSISSLVFYGKTLRNRITGNVSAGFTYTKSSQIGRLNSDGAIFYNTSKSVTQVKGDMILTWDSVSTYVERANVTLGHDYTIAPLWSAIGFLKYQRNIELGLGRRWQQAVGFGREIPINVRQRAMLVSAVAFNQEQNLEKAQTLGRELMLQANYNMFSFASPNLIVSFVESAFVSINGQQRFRLDGNLSLDYEIITDFYINFQIYHNYDSRSPATGELKTDHGFVAGFRYKF